MSEIDIQNAKQIRDPMDVLIEMELDSDDVTLSYSGYSGSAKVADGELDEPTWPMRKLADLQGDGFPLDGSCMLYDSSTTPSQTTGKLGVRGNVGEAVTITITGNKSIASLFISATGAESVTFGSTTTPIYNNVVTIPVGATSITITLNPASETTRIEVPQIKAGAKFRITNENLIRATVSLRSDLSIINPTLPESEINIEAYQDTDISEAVATIPADTPITYSAGYEGDMSPVRKFYVTGQVTWADNVLSIQGVDAVHFLDQYTLYPIESRSGMNSSSACIEHIWSGCLTVLQQAGIDLTPPEYTRILAPGEGRTNIAVWKQQTGREFLCNIMWLFHQDLSDKYAYHYTNWIANIPFKFFPTYVDAGVPTFTDVWPDPKWGIREEDCASVKKITERKIGKIRFVTTRCEIGGNTNNFKGKSSGDWLKNVGVFYNFDGLVRRFKMVAFNEAGRGEPIISVDKGTQTNITTPVPLRALPISNWLFGDKIFVNDLPQGWMSGLYGESYLDQYTQIAPWTTMGEDNQSAVWARLFGANEEPQTATLFTETIVESTEMLEVGDGVGDLVEVTSEFIGGTITANGRSSDPQPLKEVYPRGAAESLLAKSNITGSFTWKGDPRMQPRDVVEWERLDGTTTTITLENITLTHEGGGTSAEITYREGVV